MTAFLKIDDCKACHRALPWEWTPAVMIAGKALSGTGVWRSQLVSSQCPGCRAAQESEREKAIQAQEATRKLIELLGGEKPYRNFTLERFNVTPENHRAYERCRHFNAATESLYLWGACGVGKTHLAYSLARHCFEETLSVMILPTYLLSRTVRMRDPNQEQAVIQEFIAADALILDDLGAGTDTAYSQQVLQEILDGREFRNRAGLIVTSSFSLDALAEKMGRDTIPSRLAGMCQIIEMRGEDHRAFNRTGTSGWGTAP